MLSFAATVCECVRGDVLTFRQIEEIFQKQKEGVNFVFSKFAGLYLVLASSRNPSPFFALELLARLHKLFKDYCGVVTEEAIRKNFVLLYELLDEDFGEVQTTQTEYLKGFIHSAPILVDEANNFNVVDRIIQTSTRSAPSSSANRSIQAEEGSGRDEIFVDLLEKLTVLFSTGGALVTARIDGSCVMRSFLKGDPELRLSLNDDLVIGRGGTRYGRVCVDDMAFHEIVRTNTFEFDKSITFRAPDGELVLFTYRTSDDFRVPFRITPFVEEIDPKKIDVVVKLRMDVQQKVTANNVVVRLPLPKATSSASVELPSGAAGESYEYVASEKIIAWQIKKFQHESEHVAKFKINLTHPLPQSSREIGPISLTFEIPMHTCSHITIRNLKTTDGSHIPARWVRFITSANSYVYRL